MESNPDVFLTKQGVITEDTIRESRILLGKCYEEIKEVIDDYLDLSTEKKEILTLWILGTYFHNDFEAYPFLFFNAMRGSGKTRALKLISSLASKGNGSVTNNLTDAVLFRHPKGSILCIDEIEQIGSKEKSTLRELLNSAYKKGMQVKRIKKAREGGVESLITEVFEPYFPICLANIWGIEEVLGDRSLTLILEKSNDPRVIKKIEDFGVNPSILNIKRTLTEISVVCVVSLRQKTSIRAWNNFINEKYTTTNDITTLSSLTTYNNINNINIIDIERDIFFNKIDNSGIGGRNLELFLPLLMVAKLLNDEIFESFLIIAKDFVSDRQDDEFAESKDVSLYQFIAEHGVKDLINLKELTAHFKLYVGDTASGREESWVNEKWMGRALKRLQLVLFKKRVASGRLVLLNIEKAKKQIKIFGNAEDMKGGNENGI